MSTRTFAQEAASRLLRAWKRLGDKPSRPVYTAARDDAGASSTQPLAGPAPVGVRARGKKEPIPFDPSILALKVVGWPKDRRPGELWMFLPARDAMRGQGEGRPLVVDPTPQAPDPRWEVSETVTPIVPRERVARHWSRGGYLWPRHNEPAVEKCRRQLLLRTDLARLKYPRIPSPGRLMRPMIEAEFSLEPWVPLSKEPHVELKVEDLSWWRFMDHTIGAPPRPRPSWRSALAQAAEAPEGETGDGGEPAGGPKGPRP